MWDEHEIDHLIERPLDELSHQELIRMLGWQMSKNARTQQAMRALAFFPVAP